MNTLVGARRGFALLIVMMILAASAAVGLQATRTDSGALETARNRAALTRAFWSAQGCLEEFRAQIGTALRGDSLQNMVWLRIGGIAETLSIREGCHVVAQPSGMTMNIDSVTDDQLRRVLALRNHPYWQIDSMVDALRDWTDSDSIARLAGAERSWYRAAHRSGPRNGALTSIRELRLIRGFETDSQTEKLFGLESGRLSIDQAPLALIGLLPGMTSEAVAAIAALRTLGQPVGDLAILANRLTPEARQGLLSHYAEIVARTSPAPEWWTVRSESTRGEPPITATIEVRLVRSGNDVSIVRYQSWP
jgi:hypothetical protein